MWKMWLKWNNIKLFTVWSEALITKLNFDVIRIFNCNNTYFDVTCRFVKLQRVFEIIYNNP